MLGVCLNDRLENDDEFILYFLFSEYEVVMSVISLSICIPTYNRSASIVPLVNEILKSAESDIEVVVLDNDSADDTLEQLSAITDSRLAVHKNIVNRGVLFNVLHVLLKARGRHSVLLLDKDRIDPLKIGDFKEFLQREDVSCGFCEYKSKQLQQAEIFPQGIAALSRVAYTCHHPTGYFFRTEFLREADIGNRFINAAHVGHFCFEFILAELTFKGAGAIYHVPLFSHETREAAAKQKSFGTNASLEDAFFTPKERVRMAVNFSRQIVSFPISVEDKPRLIADRFLRGLTDATFGYRTVISSPELCSHYNLSSRSVSRTELLSIAIHFYSQFIIGVYKPSGIMGFFTHIRFLGHFIVYKGCNALMRRVRRK